MLNQVNIQGRMVNEPTQVYIMHTPNGDRTKYSFTIASQDDFGKKPTYFIPCCAWGKTGEFISKWFKKGYMGFFTGRLTTYKDFEKDATIVEFNVDRAEFPNKEKEDDDRPIEIEEEDIPF